VVPINKETVAQILREIAVLLELKGENQFKVRAYLNGARTIEVLDQDLKELVETGKITDIKGIGKGLGDNIRELVLTGNLDYYQELKSSIPPGLLDMLRIPGLGPKKVYRLYQTLGITSIRELEYACKENRLSDLKGFGPKSQGNILRGIEHIKKFQGQFIYAEVIPKAYNILEALKGCSEIKEISIAGSLRRFREVVKDIDLVASTENEEKVMDYFIKLPQVIEVINKGSTKTSVTLESGINCDLRLVKPSLFSYALHHFTGSKEHNTVMRHRAKSMGIKINEYGLFKGEKEELIKVNNEEEFFKALGLSYIPPELRENMGEIEAAEKNTLPELVKYQDIQGVFHIHTNYSDGRNTLAQLVEEAKKAGYKYLGIADHSQSAIYANGLQLEQIKRQRAEIQEFNEKNPDFYVFSGIEVDIHSDGTLDYPDNVLELFDFVIASIHSNFTLTGEKATQRLIKAMENPYVTMLGHPTGRILLGRQGYEPDMEEIIKSAKANNVIIELNSSPYRLDIDWRYLRALKEWGGMVSINPDAHRVEELYDTYYGVQMARKGWLEKENVFNTRSVEEVKKYLQQKRGRKNE
jgi:DNA polymerase (family 10)